jgi:FAD-dependent oxidoreductase domain-containing protein 1
MVHEVETLVIGAGLIGSSVAMNLARLGMSSIRVIDFDLEGEFSSSELNAGGVRATWTQPVNIKTSQISIDYFASVADEIGYRACGYLWLHTAERFNGALGSRELQVKLGWPVEVWDIAELKRRTPFIDKTDDIAGALFAPRDGLLNSNLLKNHFRSKARDLGVIFDDRVWVRGAEYVSSGVMVHGDHFGLMPSAEDKREFFSGGSPRLPSEQIKYRAKRVINCAGPWAAEIARILQYPCPSFSSRRQVCIFDCRDVDLTPYGMIVDTTGVYFHPEASNGLAGYCDPREPSGVNYAYDGDSFFMEVIWPALYERSTKFERLKHLTGWAGLYEISPDESAIVGPVAVGEAGKSGCVFEAHSFSGHGAMHSYGAGLALAERITRGRYETLDLTELSGKRFEAGRLVKEGLVI